MLVKMLSRLVDAFGRRFWFQSEPQTESDDSRVSQLRRHYSDHPVSGLTPARAAEILVDAERGLLLDQ